MVAEVLARAAGTRTEQRMVHINHGYLSLCLCPPNCVSCLAVMELGTGGAVMANREARRPLFRLMGRVGVGERSEEHTSELQSHLTISDLKIRFHATERLHTTPLPIFTW